MNTRYYSIHDFLSFSVKDDYGLFRKLLDTTKIQFVSFFEETKEQKTDFTIEMGAFKRKPGGYKILDNNYHVGDDYIFLTDKRKYSEWQIEIDHISNHPKAKIQTNLPGHITRPLNLIEFLIQFCLLKHGYSFIHSAAVAKGGKVLLLPGTGGAGKTTICMGLLENGYKYLGDNFIIVKNNKAFSYLTPFNIFFYNRSPMIENALGPKDRVALFCKKLLYDSTGGYIKIFQKIHPTRILKNRIEKRGIVTHLCFLEPNDKFNKFIYPPKRVSLNEVVRKLRFNMEIEWNFFNHYFISYGYINPDSLFGDFWENSEKLYKHNLEAVGELYSLGVPTYCSPDTTQEIVQHLVKLHNN